jgi:hypothetical protein
MARSQSAGRRGYGALPIDASCLFSTAQGPLARAAFTAPKPGSGLGWGIAVSFFLLQGYTANGEKASARHETAPNPR